MPPSAIGAHQHHHIIWGADDIKCFRRKNRVVVYLDIASPEVQRESLAFVRATEVLYKCRAWGVQEQDVDTTYRNRDPCPSRTSGITICATANTIGPIVPQIVVRDASFTGQELKFGVAEPVNDNGTLYGIN